MIRNIIATTGATVDVEDDGSVMISGIDQLAVQKAVDWVTGLTREVTVNEEFEGEVKRILPFGAFVEILPGKEGMVHVSQMSTGYVNNPEEVVKIGQKVHVRVMEVDDMHRINLSMLFGEDAKKAPVRERREGGDRPRRPFNRGPRRF
jgi:polyribonucleotide nucleotidyltransferase